MMAIDRPGFRHLGKMLYAAAVGFALVQQEGASAATLLANPRRPVATLRA